MTDHASAVPRPLVLIVEDNQDLAEVYEVILSLQGYRVATASNGRTGLESVGQLAPDVVILDMMMPEMDGLEFLERLPGQTASPPPVIVNSGFDEFEERTRALGARAFLGKPVPRDELVAAIERVLAGREETERERARPERVAARRREACIARDRLWGRIDLDDAALRAPIEALAEWLPHYLGFGKALVDLMCGDSVYVYAGAGKPESHQREFAFCSNVVDAGSSLLIPDTTSHPVFSDHGAIAYWGTRFYAGCPITLRSELVVGTVCVIDTVPRDFGTGDMLLLEHLAQRIGGLLETAAAGAQPSPFFEAPGLFDATTLEAVLAKRLRETADTELVLVALARDPRTEPLHAAASAVHHATPGLRVLSARWAPRTLAILCDGPDVARARARGLEALERASLRPRGVGIASYRSALFRSAPARDDVTAGQLIAAADAACARSANQGGGPVHELMRPRPHTPQPARVV